LFAQAPFHIRYIAVTLEDKKSPFLTRNELMAGSHNQDPPITRDVAQLSLPRTSFAKLSFNFRPGDRRGGLEQVVRNSPESLLRAVAVEFRCPLIPKFDSARLAPKKNRVLRDIEKMCVFF
jgi:hypothetical protein